MNKRKAVPEKALSTTDVKGEKTAETDVNKPSNPTKTQKNLEKIPPNRRLQLGDNNPKFVNPEDPNELPEVRENDGFKEGN